MRMLFLYRGWNSGTNQSVYRAWAAGTPEHEIIRYDVCPLNWRKRFDRLRALPHAIRRGGFTVLMRRDGQFTDAVKRSAWCMKQIAATVRQIQQKEDYDFAFCMGSITPILSHYRPYFIYTDLVLLANLYYPGGRERVDLWRECLQYEKDTIHGAAMIFTMSNHVTQSLIEHYGIPASRILKVNGGCNVPSIENPDPQRYERQNVLFIGVDWERKGGPELLEAFGRVRRRHPRATLTILGCRPDVCAPGVEVVGFVSQEQVPYFLARATIYCMPSKREPFGIAYLEALHAGLPVIASNLGATSDFIIDGETGYRVDPNNIDEIEKKMEELIADPEKCRRMGLAGHNLVESQYSWAHTQKNMWKAIQQVLK